MVVPVPRPFSTLTPWEVRLRREGARLVLEPVVWSAGMVRALVLATVVATVVAAGAMVILGASGERRLMFIPPGLVGFLWALGVAAMVLDRRARAEEGPLCSIDPGERTVEIPREHLVLRGAGVRSLHLVTFRVAKFPPEPRPVIRAGRQLLAMVEQDGHDGLRPLPLATGRFAASVPAVVHELARALAIKVEFHDAPDQAPGAWP